MGPRRLNLNEIWTECLEGRPLSPLNAIDRSQIVWALSVGVLQPLLVLVRVLVPDLADKRPEIGRASRAAQEAHQLANCRLEGQLLGCDGREALLEVKAHHCARNAQGSHPSAVLL